MRLRGFPPDGVPAVSYVGTPTGSIIGSSVMPVGKILSVPGQPGPRGPVGLTGSQGPRGEVGERGPAGETGGRGLEGPIGPPGDGLELAGQVPTYAQLPPTAANGDVWLAGTKLYRYNNGWPTEPNGSEFRGPQGPVGETGPAGPVGPAGERGERGLTGQTGATGGVGPQGPKGDRGDTGLTGAPGTTDYNALANKPSTFPPSTHTHPVSDVTGLQSTLDSKLNQSQVDARVAVGTSALVGSAPTTLDTLNELAAALGNDPNFATTVATQIGTKVGHDGTVLDIRKVTQAQYDALGAGRPATRLYVIVG